MLNTPILDCENMSAEELDKYCDASLWIFENLTLAPFKAFAKAFK